MVPKRDARLIWVNNMFAYLQGVNVQNNSFAYLQSVIVLHMIFSPITECKYAK